MIQDTVCPKVIMKITLKIHIIFCTLVAKISAKTELIFLDESMMATMVFNFYHNKLTQTLLAILRSYQITSFLIHCLYSNHAQLMKLKRTQHLSNITIKFIWKDTKEFTNVVISLLFKNKYILSCKYHQYTKICTNF